MKAGAWTRHRKLWRGCWVWSRPITEADREKHPEWMGINIEQYVQSLPRQVPTEAELDAYLEGYRPYG